MEQIGLSAILDLSEFDRNIGRYLSGLDKIDNANNKMAGQFGKAFDDMGQGVLRVAGLLSGALVAGAVAAGAAIGAFTVNGIKKAADLESQMGAIAAVMGETKDAVGPLKDLILDLGMDPMLKVNAQEAADAIEKLASNGLTMTQVMDGAAKATVLLANSTDADFGTAAAIATDSMVLFNIGAADMMKAVNGITGVTVASKFNINDYRLALAQAGGVASATGVEFDDFNTSIAGIANYFASGSDAGTSFKTMLQRLIPQSDNALKIMMELGLATADGSSNFFDASGNMKSMGEISSMLNTALGGLTEEQKNNALSTIFGTDAMRAAVGLAEQGEVAYTDQATAAKALGVSYDSLTVAMQGGLTKFEALAIQLGNTDAAEAAKVRMDNFKGSMEILRGVIDTVALKIGFLFLPMLKQLADRASELITQYAPMIVEFFDSFATGIEKIVSGAGWQEVFPAWLVGTIDLVAQNIDILTGALGGVAVLLASAGIAAALSAIGAALAGLLSPMALLIGGAAALGIAWNTNFLGLRDTTLAVLDAVTNAFAPLTTAIQEFGTGALAEIANFAAGNETEFTNIKAIWDGAIQSVQNLFSGIISAVTANLPIWQAQLTEWGAAAWAWIVEAGSMATVKIGEWATALIGALAANLPTWIAAYLEWSAGMVTWIGDAIAGGITALGEWAGALVGWLTGEGKTQIGGGALLLVGALIDWIANDLIPKVAPAMVEYGAALGGALLKIAAALGIDAVKIGVAIIDAIMTTDYKSIGVNILTYIRDGWNTTASAVLTVVAAFATNVKAKFNEIDWKAIGTTILTYIRDGWEATKATVLTGLGVIVASFKERFGETANNWTAAGKDILDKVRAGIESAKETALATITTVVADMRRRYVTPDGFAWGTIGTDIMNAIRDGLQQAAQAAGGILATVVQIATFIKDQFTKQSWDEIGATIMNAIRDGLDAAAKAAGGLLTVVKNIGMDLMKAFTEINWEEVGRTMARLLKDGFKALAEGAGGLLPTAKTVGTGVFDAFANIDWLDLGRTIIAAVGAGVKAVAYAAGGLIYIVSEIVEGFTEELFSVDWQTLGGDIITLVQDGVEGAADALLNLVTDIVDNILRIFRDVDWPALGREIINRIRDGIESAKVAFLNLMSNITADIRKIFTDLADTWKEIGMDIVNGIGAGITAAKDSLIKKAQDLANSLPEWVKKVLGISSPSKVFAEIGRNIVEGLIVGMEQQRSQLLTTAASLAGSLGYLFNSGQLLNMKIDFSDNFGQRLAEIADRWRSTITDTRFSDATRQFYAQQVTGMDAVTRRLSETKESIGLQEDQLKLMQQAATLGIDISGIPDANRTAEHIKRLAELELEIARARQLQLYAETQQVKNNVSLILQQERYNQILQNNAKLIERVNSTNSAMGKLYKEQVLDPILETTLRQATTEADRQRAIDKYIAASQQLLELNRQEQQLDFLKQQLDLVKQVKDSGLDANQIFAGMTLGINASVADLLTATQRAVAAMIAQVNQQLQIRSPSKVFADIGGQMMAGMAQGIQKSLFQPLNALRQSTVAHGAVSTRTLNFAMGGVTINTPMDEVHFESRVLRILERSMN